MKTTLFCILLCLFFGCGMLHPNENSTTSYTVKSGDSVTISMKVGESVVLNQMHTLTLKSLSDSRCAEDVVCVWEGVASGQFDLALSGVQNDFQLDSITSGNFKSHVKVTGYAFKMLDVTPYPNQKKGTKGEVVKVEVSMI